VHAHRSYDDGNTEWDPLSGKLWTEGLPDFGIFWISGPLAEKNKITHVN
jgi:hypothetical protein